MNVRNINKKKSKSVKINITLNNFILCNVMLLSFPYDILAAPAIFFDDDLSAGRTKIISTIQNADTNSGQTSTIFEIDLFDNPNGIYTSTVNGQSVYVKTTRNGSVVPNEDFGTTLDGFTGWSNNYVGDFSNAENLGYKLDFYSDSSLSSSSRFPVNALGIFVDDWGTCCVRNNSTPYGTNIDSSEVYIKFDNNAPLLVGGISQPIPPKEHFIGAINDTNFFSSITIIASGRGEYFAVGGNLIFSSVALNSVPAGSSQISGQGIQAPPPAIPDIDTQVQFYDTSQLANAQVNPVFAGGTLRILTADTLTSSFAIQALGGTIDTYGRSVAISGVMSGTGSLTKTGAGTLTLTGANTYSGGTTVSAGRLAGNTTSLQGAITNNVPQAAMPAS